MKRYILIFLFAQISTFAFSQNRTEFWSKVNVIKTLNPKWSVGLDVQYRTQANYHTSGNKQLFNAPLAQSARLWVYYKLPNNWTITTAPIAYFHNTDVGEQAILTHSNELRTTWGITKGFQFHQLKNKNRFLYEARFMGLEKPVISIQNRYRLQNNLSFPILKLGEKNVFSIFAMNEIMLKTQKSKTNFDQNRTYLALQYQFKGIEIVSGYQHIFQQGSSSVFQRRTWLTSLNIQIP